MKKLLSLLVSASLLVGSFALAENFFAPAQTNVPETESAVMTETTAQKIETMIPVLDALTEIADGTEHTVFDPADAEQLWNALRMITADPNGAATVSSETLRSLARVCFDGTMELPMIPETLAMYITAADGLYTLVADTEPSDGYTAVESYAFDENGDLWILLSRYDRTTSLRREQWIARLVPANDWFALDEADHPYHVFSLTASADASFAEEYAVLTALAPTGCFITHDIATSEPVDETAPYYSELKVGARGDRVAALQERLTELGYNCGRVDGIFGIRTRRAVRYFQDALDAAQNGVASVSLQEHLFAGEAPVYVPYVSLSKGSRGIRVERLQEALHTLGYLAEPVDGIYGPRTKAAVTLFQLAVGIDASGRAGETTLKKLYASDAPQCDDYIDLRMGDTGCRVYEMQHRLKELELLGKASGVYDGSTAQAVKMYKKLMGIKGDGKTADAWVVESMFTRPLPTVKPTAKPTATPTSKPTATPTAKPTEAPVEPTEAPVEPTEAPVEPTEAPVEPTEAPVEPTEAPVEPTEAPVEPTEAPVEPTEAPVEPTEAPVEPTEAPVEPTEAPEPEPTEAPEPEPTEAPAPAPVQVITDAQLKSMVSMINTVTGNDLSATKVVNQIQKLLGIEQTGVYDQTTFDEVLSLQSSSGLSATGIVDEDTLNLWIN